jgi:hypothetical protein
MAGNDYQGVIGSECGAEMVQDIPKKCKNSRQLGGSESSKTLIVFQKNDRICDPVKRLG